MSELGVQPWILCSGETPLASFDLKSRMLAVASAFHLEGDSYASCRAIPEAKSNIRKSTKVATGEQPSKWIC